MTEDDAWEDFNMAASYEEERRIEDDYNEAMAIAYYLDELEANEN